MSYDKFLGYLRSLSKELDSKFERSVNINHNASKGSVREAFLENIIKPLLPKVYGLIGGECFSKDGNVSKQLDIIIYDTLYSYILPMDKGFAQFPCESVYGNIEVKSKLDKKEFKSSIENIKSLKMLKRAKTDGLQITPYFKLNLGSNLEYSGSQSYNDYIGVIFAYNSIAIKELANYFKEIPKEDLQYAPDFIICYRKKTIFFRAKNTSTAPMIDVMLPDFEYFLPFELGDDTIPVFIFSLLSLLRLKKLACADINNYCIKLLHEINSDTNKGKPLANLRQRIIEENLPIQEPAIWFTIPKMIKK